METGLENINLNRVKIKSYTNVIISALLLIISLLVVIFAVKPLYSSYNSNKAEIESLNQKMTSLDKRLAELKNVEAVADSVKQYTDLSQQAVPFEDDIPVVMTMIQYIAEDSGIEISSFSYSGMSNAATTPVGVDVPTTSGAPSDLGDNFDAFNMNISVKGNFSSILEFIKNIENSRRLVDISNFNYKSNNESTENPEFTNSVDSQILLTSYFKDFNNVPTDLNIDAHSDTIEDLQVRDYREVNIDVFEIGRDDPFLNSNENPIDSNQIIRSGTNNGGIGLNNTAPNTDFFNEDTGNNPGEVNIVEVEGENNEQPSDSTTNDNQQDVEAEEGDLNEVLLQLIQEEQGNNAN